MLTLRLIICFVLLSAGTAMGQQRYDELAPQQRFSLSLGSLTTNNYDTSIRVNSKKYGLGTYIRLEDGLNVEKSLSTARLSGFYRFNERHLIQWNYYQSKREGHAIIEKDPIQIGVNTYQVGSELNSRIENKILQLGWSYSLVNVQKYELLLGAGLNIRQTTLAFTGSYTKGSSSQSQQGNLKLKEYLPLPTVNLGIRYNFTPKLSMIYHFETFAIAYGDFDGVFKSTYLNLEYNAFKHAGVGIGINSVMSDLEVQGSQINGELESNHLAGLF